MTELNALNHTGSVRLETTRLILRPTSISDAEQMFANWASDPEVTKYLMWLPHDDVEITKGILTNWDKENEKPDYYHWGIELKDNGQIIGTGGTLGINERHRSTELGYCSSHSQWGRGLMTEAVAAMIEHLFNVVGLNRIAAVHDTNNPASGRVMQKNGMVFEGIRRQAHFCTKRGFYDLACYAILKDEYEKKTELINSD